MIGGKPGAREQGVLASGEMVRREDYERARGLLRLRPVRRLLMICIVAGST